MFGPKWSFLSVTLVKFDMPVLGANIQCRKHCRLSYVDNAFVYTEEEVRIANRYGLLLMIVDAKVL